MSDELTSFELKVSQQMEVLGRDLTEEELHELWDELTEQELAEIVAKKFAEFTESFKIFKSGGESNE